VTAPFRIFIGWDSAQQDAYEVCAFSLTRHASVSLDIRPLKLSELRARGLYWRGLDPRASTEFTYSRFLAPALSGFDGHALYCDCDFLFTADVAELVALADCTKAVQCVQHHYRPLESTKMDGKTQTQYPRKNWSSLMLFNCAHAETRRLTPETVNAQTGEYLQRLHWAKDDAIGALPAEWNWLENPVLPVQAPKAIHFTRGGPWLEQWHDAAYADLWRAEKALMLERRR